LRQPVGVAFRDGALYVSAVNRIVRFDDIERRLDAPPEPVVVTDRFPSDGSHGWKFIAFGPDGKLYVPVGAPCNICEPDPDRYANVTRMNPDGSGFEVVARGIRNSVGFDWDPRTHDLWLTNNGPRHAGRRRSAGHAASRHEARRALRLSVLPRGRHCRSAIRQQARVPRLRAAGGALAPMSRRSACASTPARSSPPNTATRCSSPSMARGTAATRSAIA
jgi:hypothetical protein